MTAGAVAVAAISTRPVVVRDSRTDAASKAIDLMRVQLGRASDGRLRAAVTATESWAPKDLVASKGGPPGSICLRLYTGGSKVEGVVPDYLVCITATKSGKKLRGSVLRERTNDFPERVTGAKVTRSSKRTVVVKFSQSSIGKPATVRFSAESTRAGCTRTSCVDAAPNLPTVGTVKLREPSATTNRPE
ncbi:hypothetical protein [Paraconexibacter sp.]|uniref:hypothetical protein n=1 Tax=Paraconexibacter sp. TaxID=2949640 RepID=UPI003566B91F